MQLANVKCINVWVILCYFVLIVWHFMIKGKYMTCQKAWCVLLVNVVQFHSKRIISLLKGSNAWNNATYGFSFNWCKIQIERWDRIGLDINAICANLGETCLQLFSIHTLSGCDTTSYHYAKGMFTLLNNLFVRDNPGWANLLGEGSIK